MDIKYDDTTIWSQPNDSSRLIVSEPTPVIKIQSVDLTAIVEVGKTYNYNVTLINGDSTARTVTLKIHSSVSGDLSTYSANVPANGTVKVPITTTFTPAGVSTITYTVVYNNQTLDTMSMTVEAKNASITLSTISGSVGTSVTITGSAFRPNETGIVVTFDDIQVTSPIMANTSGEWTTSFSIPSVASDFTHNVDAHGNNTLANAVPNVIFTIVPSISLSKTSGTSGSSLTITGAGFRANETAITVTYDGVGVASGILTSSTGSWAATFVVPPSAIGSHIIDAYGSITQANLVTDVALSIVSP